MIIENNLWYASAFVYGNYNPICNQLKGACTVDFNASFQGDDALSASNWQTQETPAAHDHNVSGTANPFSGLQPALTIEGYEPAASHPFMSNDGVKLGSPYNADMLGNSRGSNGIWDRGGAAKHSRSLDPENHASHAFGPTAISSPVLLTLSPAQTGPVPLTVTSEDVPLMARPSCLDRSYRCGTHLERIHTTYAERTGI